METNDFVFLFDLWITAMTLYKNIQYAKKKIISFTFPLNNSSWFDVLNFYKILYLIYSAVSSAYNKAKTSLLK